MKIRWLQIALDDINSIAEYISLNNHQAAIRIVKLIHSNVRLLIDQPSIGRTGRVPETRELIISGSHFIVPYRIKDNEIHILRVIHSSREWPNDF